MNMNRGLYDKAAGVMCHFSQSVFGSPNTVEFHVGLTVTSV